MRSFASLRTSLEGKKAHLEGLPAYLEGTWRAVVGRLEGKGESIQTIIHSHSTGKTALTWRVFGKSIYMDNHEKTECHNHTSRKCSNGAGLQRAYTDTMQLSSLTEIVIVCVDCHSRNPLAGIQKIKILDSASSAE